MADDPLAFGIDLDSVRDRLKLLRYFNSIEGVLDASEALDGTVSARPPAAFIGTANETAGPNIIAAGGFAQRVQQDLAIVFVESAARGDRKGRDALDKTARAVIRQLIAWKPDRAQAGLEYRRYRVLSLTGGLAWGEVTMSGEYRLQID